MLMYSRRIDHAGTTAFLWSWRYRGDKASALTITATVHGIRITGVSALLALRECEQFAEALGCATVAHELLVSGTPYTKIEQHLTQMEELSREATATEQNV